MLTHCETDTGRSALDRPIKRRFALTRLRAWFGTGLLLAGVLGVMSPPAALAQIAVPAAAASYLSDRTWTSMTNGWGPVEKDRSNGEQADHDGATLTLNGVTYPKGLGTHAPSDIRFALNRACTSLTATVGVDDEKGSEGSVIFQVWTDGVKQFDSGIMTGLMPSANVNVSLANVTEIALIVTDAGDGNWSDHGDWADARVSCGGSTIIPTGTTASQLPPSGTVAAAATANGALSVAKGAAPTTTSRHEVNPPRALEPAPVPEKQPAVVRLVGRGSATPVPVPVSYKAPSKAMPVAPRAGPAAISVQSASIKGDARGATRLASTALADQAVPTVAPPINVVDTTAAVYPGEDIQARVNAAPPGSAFLLKSGVHRLQTISPLAGDTFTGEAGTVLSGATLLTDLTRSGSYWVASGQTQQGATHGECAPGYPRCANPEQLFLNDQLLTPVATLGEVGAGTWFFDYDADRIYFADDPTGGRLETSVAAAAFLNTANNVTITKLTVEKYANAAQSGPITAENTSGWIITANEIRWNHGGGIRIGTGAQITGNFVHHNGQLGIVGVGDDVLVENNEISYNNQAHFAPGWEAGGTKFVLTNRLVVRGNFVHHNIGPGLWTDIDNINTLYENNTVEDNEEMGIFHEISWAAIIRGNIVRRNGFGTWVPAGYIWGVGILVAASPNVEITDNTVENNNGGIAAVQQARGDGLYGPHEIANLYVHDNRTVVSAGWTGLVVDTGDNSYFTSRNTRFERNTYQLNGNSNYFTWMNADRSEAEWTAFGLDVGGSFAH